MSKTRLLASLLCCFFTQILTAQNWFSTGQKAEIMLSGLDFNETGGALFFNHPSGLATDGTRFLLCDRFNNRVLVWNSLPQNWNDAPDLVLGQPDFHSNNPGNAKNQLNWAGNASLSPDGKIAVADTENDRILIWKKFPTENAQAADLSLFLPKFTPAGSPIFYGWPWGVWTDGTRLAAVATSGGALLFWNSMPASDDTPPDFSIRLPQFGTPRNISTDGSTYFFVGDHNAKVNGKPGTFFWNSYPTTADQSYDFYRDEWIKGERLPDGKLVAAGIQSIQIWEKMPTAAGQNPDLVLAPAMYKNGDGVDLASGASGEILVNNYNGNNVLAFQKLPDAAGQLPDFAVGAATIYAQTLDSIHYLQNPVLASDGTRLVATSDFDRAIYVWDKLPTQSGQPADHKFSTAPNVHLWANCLFKNQFVAAARNTVSIWDDASKIGAAPSRQLVNNIGTATLSDIVGVALDSHFFYLATKDGKLHLWQSLPTNTSQNPFLTISKPGAQFGFLHSDGNFLCLARPEPPTGVDIFKVSELASGNTQAFKTLAASPQLPLNQASQGIVFNGKSFAVSSRGNHSVLLWEDIADVGNPQKMCVLGQKSASDHEAAIGTDRLFMPSSLLSVGGGLWVGEFKFSSRILKFSPQKSSAASDVEFELGLKIFPNPAASTGQFTVQFEPRFSEKYVGELFDAGGRSLGVLFSEKLVAGEIFNRSFDGREFFPSGGGVYFLKISSGKSRTWMSLVGF